MSDQQPDLGAMISGLFGGEGGGFDLSKLSAMLAPLMGIIQQNGGLQGLLEKLQSSGLGDQVSSWLGAGANAAANPQQLTEALGVDSSVAEQMSSALPNLVDKLSPNGQLPSTDQLQGMLQNLPGGDQLGGLLNGLLGGK